MTDVELIVEMLSRGPCFYGHVVLLLDDEPLTDRERRGGSP